MISVVPINTRSKIQNHWWHCFCPAIYLYMVW